jgi:hypothetical protein
LKIKLKIKIKEKISDLSDENKIKKKEVEEKKGIKIDNI